MRRIKHKRRKILKFGAIALLIIFLISAFLVALQVWEKRQGVFPVVDTDEEFVTYEGKQYIQNDRVETFLVLGLDKFDGTSTADSYNNDKQADFLMLFVFDNEAKKVTALHINRDTMANVNILGLAGDSIDTVKKQIALAHTYGNGRDVSCRNTVDSVSDLLFGVNVNHYISLTMDSVPVLNDLVGGVEVTVKDDFTGIDSTLVKGKTITLKGEQALRYIRTRYGLEDSTNIARMERQQQYINALYEKMQKCIQADDEFVVEAALKMSEHIVSDRSITQLQELARKFNEYEFQGIKSIEGENKKGEEYMEFYPNDELLKKTTIELFYKEKK